MPPYVDELSFERALIEKLTRDCGWSETVLSNPTEDVLIQNWANIIYQNNRNRESLGDYPLTRGEMAQIIGKVNACRTPLQLNEFINGKTTSIIRDNPEDITHFNQTVPLKLYDRNEIAGGDSRYQIAEQPRFNIQNPLIGNRRGDLMLLINGMPFIHIELKRSGVPVSQACNQIKMYTHEGVFSQGIFSLVQVFVAMNPDETLYFANPGREGVFKQEYFFHWENQYNQYINDWPRIAESLLSIPMAHQLIGFYTIADKADKVLKVMRSYQYYATKAIVDKARKIDWTNPDVRGGFIYHTTGSGKTMTSFKAAHIIAESGLADIVVLLTDRIELGSQTLKEFRNFAGNMINVYDTENTNDLITKLKDGDAPIIVTSHQKMSEIQNEIHNREADISAIQKKRIILIVDEAHRDVFGNMFNSIKAMFPGAVRFGFTGTPIINRRAETESTTADVFGNELHRYTIAEGIRDKNVLGFHTIPVLVYQPNDIRKSVALDRARASSEEDALNNPQKRQIYYQYMDMPMAYSIDIDGNRINGIEDYLPNNQYSTNEYYRSVVEDISNSWTTLSRGSRFHAIFATSSILEAIDYYTLIRTEMPELRVTAIYDWHNENNQNSIEKEIGTLKILNDYNQWFGTSYSFNISDFDKFRKDVTARLAHKEPFVGIEDDTNKQIHMVIVVDQLLTGFDSKWINTLYMDKIQENEKIIQSFSRTNRIFNYLEKPFGTIKYYKKPFTMKKNIELAIQNYAGENPFEVFINRLEIQLNGMNQTYDEMKNVFVTAGIDDFSHLPEDNSAKGIFAKLFKDFCKYLAAANVQDFSWEKDSYEFSDADENMHTITMHLDEEKYHILLQRYKELNRNGNGNQNPAAPYDIDINITELDTELIDNEYMNTRFTKYVDSLNNENTQETEELLSDLHRSFAMLNQEEQNAAELILGDIQRGKLDVDRSKTFRDYINLYKMNEHDRRVHSFAETFGLNENLLIQAIQLNREHMDLNTYGTFNSLKESVNFDRASEYLNENIGENVPRYLVLMTFENILREFIRTGNF